MHFERTVQKVIYSIQFIFVYIMSVTIKMVSSCFTEEWKEKHFDKTIRWNSKTDHICNIHPRIKLWCKDSCRLFWFRICHHSSDKKLLDDDFKLSFIHDIRTDATLNVSSMEYSNSNQIDWFRFSAQNQMLKLNYLFPSRSIGYGAFLWTLSVVSSSENNSSKTHLTSSSSYYW